MTNKYSVSCQGYEGHVCSEILAFWTPMNPNAIVMESQLRVGHCPRCAAEDAKRRPVDRSAQNDSRKKAKQIAERLKAKEITATEATLLLIKLITGEPMVPEDPVLPGLERTPPDPL